LSALEFVSRGGLQLAQIVKTVVGQPVSLEPRPQIFDGIEIRGIGRKKGDLDVPVQRIRQRNPSGRFPAARCRRFFAVRRRKRASDPRCR
jgi:hypothetical protein